MDAQSHQPFNPLDFLRRIDPLQTYTIEILTGGIMNMTVRATKLVHDRGLFKGHNSLILKHSPPFVAGIGESLPMTTFRQTIEARALSLFSQGNEYSLRDICTESSVSVPEILSYDRECHVLIISDLGNLPNLAHSFSDLGGYYNKPLSPLDNEENDGRSQLNSEGHISYYETLGTRLGIFFARLHSPKTLQAIIEHPDRGTEFLKNPYLSNFAFENGIKPIKHNLQLFPQFLDKEEAAILYERAAGDNTIPLEDGENSLIMADCWPGSIITSPLDSSLGAMDPTKIEVGVVDWEFATVGRGLNNDLAQLLARFCLLHCAAVCREDMVRQKQLSALAFAIMESYRNTSEQHTAPWAKHGSECSSEVGETEEEEKDSNPFNLKPSTLRAKMLRSMFLTYGIEIMRCGFAKTWNCHNDACIVDGQHAVPKNECPMIQNMVQCALWYFRHACENTKEFCSPANQSLLQKGCIEGRWLMNLF